MARGSSQSDFNTTRYIEQNRPDQSPKLERNSSGRPISFTDELDDDSNIPERDRNIIGWTNPINGAKAVAVNGDSIILLKPDGGAMISPRRVVEAIQKDQTALANVRAVMDKVGEGSALKQPGADLSFGGYRNFKNGYAVLVSNYESRAGMVKDGKYEVIVVKGGAQSGKPIPFDGKDIHDSLTGDQVLDLMKRVGKIK
jgi:hypothetical protein